MKKSICSSCEHLKLNEFSYNFYCAKQSTPNKENQCSNWNKKNSLPIVLFLFLLLLFLSSFLFINESKNTLENKKLNVQNSNESVKITYFNNDQITKEIVLYKSQK